MPREGGRIQYAAAYSVESLTSLEYWIARLRGRTTATMCASATYRRPNSFSISLSFNST